MHVNRLEISNTKSRNRPCQEITLRSFYSVDPIGSNWYLCYESTNETRRKNPLSVQRKLCPSNLYPLSASDQFCISRFPKQEFAQTHRRLVCQKAIKEEHNSRASRCRSNMPLFRVAPRLGNSLTNHFDPLRIEQCPWERQMLILPADRSPIASLVASPALAAQIVQWGRHRR